MPQADAYIAQLLPPSAGKTVVRNKILTQIEAATLTQALRADASDLYYSAWISFVDALNGINRGFYTWATVKLYYSVFYSFRASLSVDGFCAFHVDRSSFTISARAGTSPTSCVDRGTHKTVLKAFQRRNPNHTLLSQKIDLQEATDWLIEVREAANYRRSRFSEPNSEVEFAYVSKNGLRKSLAAYTADTANLYTFDPDHAVVAYPLFALRVIGEQLRAAGLSKFEENEQTFLITRARDASGALTMIVAEIKRLAPIE